MGERKRKAKGSINKAMDDAQARGRKKIKCHFQLSLISLLSFTPNPRRKTIFFPFQSILVYFK